MTPTKRPRMRIGTAKSPRKSTKRCFPLVAIADDLAYNSYGCACDYFSQKEKNGNKILSMTWEIWSETKSRAMLAQGGLQHADGDSGKLFVSTASETETKEAG